MNNLSLNALEKKANLSHQSVCKWGTSIPSGDRILKVAEYFDVSVDYLLGHTDNPKSHKNAPCYDIVGTVTALQQIKAEITAKADSLSSLVDDKITETKKLEQVSPMDAGEQKRTAP